MGVEIREADLSSDRGLLLDILLRNRKSDGKRREERFEWSYFRNPFGESRAWLVFDKTTSRAVGMAGAFPRRVKLGDRVVTAWNTGDTSIDQDFRTLGVAIKLRRAVRDDLADSGRFLYQFPVDRMRAVLERVGHKALSRFVRYGAILRADSVVRERLGRNPAASLLAGIVNLALPAQWVLRSEDRRFRVTLQSGAVFGGEYDDLYERARRHHRIMTERDSRFLHWRFSEFPLPGDLRVYRLERGDDLMGYAVVGLEGSAARILDLLVDGSHGETRTLLLGLIRQLRSDGVCTLAMLTVTESPLLEDTRPLGFVFKKPGDSVMIYTPDPDLSTTLLDQSNWHLTQADRDV